MSVLPQTLLQQLSMKTSTMKKCSKSQTISQVPYIKGKSDVHLNIPKIKS